MAAAATSGGVVVSPRASGRGCRATRTAPSSPPRRRARPCGNPPAAHARQQAPRRRRRSAPPRRCSAASTGSSSSTIAITTDDERRHADDDRDPRRPGVLDRPEEEHLRDPGATSPASRNGSVSPSGRPSPAMIAAATHSDEPTSALDSAPSSASAPRRSAMRIEHRGRAEQHRGEAGEEDRGHPRGTLSRRIGSPRGAGVHRRRRIDRQPARRAPLARDRGLGAVPPARARGGARGARAARLRPGRLRRATCARPPTRRSSPTATWRSSRRRRPRSRPPPERLEGRLPVCDGDDDPERPRRGGGRRAATATGRCSPRSRS